MSDLNFNPVIETVLQAGKALKENFGVSVALHSKSELASDIVTQLDLDTEKFLEEQFAKYYPEFGFKGEEFGHRGKKDTFWLVDPIDGTGFFARGIPICTCQLALIQSQQVIFSVIYNFITGEMFVAEKGKGATCNGTQIHVSTRKLRDSYMIMESKFDDPQHLELFLKLRKKCVQFDSQVSGYELAQIAAGKMDGRIAIDAWGKDYDYAPGSLLIQEAGGIFANPGLKSYDYQNPNYIATNEVIFKELTEGEGALFPIS